MSTDIHNTFYLIFDYLFDDFVHLYYVELIFARVLAGRICTAVVEFGFGVLAPLLVLKLVVGVVCAPAKMMRLFVL